MNDLSDELLLYAMTFVDARQLCRVLPCSKAFHRAAEGAINHVVLGTPLGQLIHARHAAEGIAMSFLALCVQICPQPGQYMMLNKKHAPGGVHVAADRLACDDLYQPSVMSGSWAIVLFVLEGFVVCERCEGRWNISGRFPVARMSLPHLIQSMPPTDIAAWEGGTPIPRQNVAAHCWAEGWDMYTAAEEHW
jgi:hypothetical protein